jgi:hypothetical protein
MGEYFDWDGLAESLSKPKFANLRMVRVKWQSRPGAHCSVVEKFLKEDPLSAVASKGLLELGFIPSSGGYVCESIPCSAGLASAY